jgi:hypothetical protein
VLFQTGYLTIDRVEELEGENFYFLTYPNREVRVSLNKYFLKGLTQSTPSHAAHSHRHIYKALEQGECVALHKGLLALFAAIPNDWYRKNQLANYEGFYASIIYSCFYALGVTVIAEDVTHQGRIDLTVKLGDNLYIIEFKELKEKGDTGQAMAQIKAKNYQQKYVNSDKNVFLIGIEFDKTERNIVRFDCEQV